MTWTIESVKTNPKIPSGEEEFVKLDEQQQLSVLGKGRFELYKAGKLDFGKLAKFTDDKVWGRSLRAKTLGELGYSVSDVRSFVKGKIDKIKSIILPGKQVAQNSAEKILKKYEKVIVTQNYESSMALDSSGNVILRKDGSSGNVFFTPAESASMKDGILTHNHPSYGGSFSYDDIHFAMGQDLEAIRAVGNEYLHIMARTPGMWDESYWQSQAVQDTLFDAEMEANNLYGSRYNNKLIDERTYAQERTHYVGVNYLRIWDGIMRGD